MGTYCPLRLDVNGWLWLFSKSDFLIYVALKLFFNLCFKKKKKRSCCGQILRIDGFVFDKNGLRTGLRLYLIISLSLVPLGLP